MTADSSPDGSNDAVGAWLRLACDAAVVRRALGYAVVVGTILIAIHHDDAILAGELDSPRGGPDGPDGGDSLCRFDVIEHRSDSFPSPSQR